MRPGIESQVFEFDGKIGVWKKLPGKTRLFSVRDAPASGAILTEECDGFDLGAKV